MLVLQGDWFFIVLGPDPRPYLLRFGGRSGGGVGRGPGRFRCPQRGPPHSSPNERNRVVSRPENNEPSARRTPPQHHSPSPRPCRLECKARDVGDCSTSSTSSTTYQICQTPTSLATDSSDHDPRSSPDSDTRSDSDPRSDPDPSSYSSALPYR